jgi:hypothetical protein
MIFIVWHLIKVICLAIVMDAADRIRRRKK